MLIRPTRSTLVYGLSAAISAIAIAAAPLAAPALTRVQPQGTTLAFLCPPGQSQLTITGDATQMYLCQDLAGSAYLYNESKHVWNITDHDPGFHSFYLIAEPTIPSLFRQEVASDQPSSFIAPNEEIMLPEGYVNITIEPDQNLTTLWVVQGKLKGKIVSYMKNSFITTVSSSSPGGDALVQCGKAAWSALSEAEQVSQKAGLQKLVIKGISAASKSGKCGHAINVARDKPDSQTFNVLRKNVEKIDKAVTKSSSIEHEFVVFLEEVSKFFHLE